ncbi:MAG: aldo/keto reductase [Alistipes sp.]|nr:aldo/keto reductase [Candidatus Alistipes equi]
MQNISRKDFIKKLSLASLTVAGAGMFGACKQISKRKDDEANEYAQTGEMTYRIGKSHSDKVSLLGFGCMRLPTIQQDDEKTQDDEVDQEMVNKMVDYAISHGVNYFDTSPAYCQGLSEKAMGIALSRYPRESYYIATKLSNFATKTHSREKSMEMYKKSFDLLQVSYIDYYLLHSVGGGKDSMQMFNERYEDNGMLDFLLEQRQLGKIRHLGFSYHGDVKIFDYLLSINDRCHWDFVQIQMNYLDWNHAKDTNKRNTDASYLYGKLEELGIQVVIMEPLLGGRLADVPGGVAKQFLEREPDQSVASWAFRFVGSFPNVLTVLSGMKYMEHLKENIKTYSPLMPLSEEEMRFMEEMAKQIVKFPSIPCTGCEYCMPCPYGINIPDIFAHYNKFVSESKMPDKESETYHKNRREFMIDYARKVERERQADHCIGCNQCVSHCPQRIKIPTELRRIDEFIQQLKKDIYKGV